MLHLDGSGTSPNSTCSQTFLESGVISAGKLHQYALQLPSQAIYESQFGSLVPAPGWLYLAMEQMIYLSTKSTRRQCPCYFHCHLLSLGYNAHHIYHVLKVPGYSSSK